jgi:hypothetical protein
VPETGDRQSSTNNGGNTGKAVAVNSTLPGEPDFTKMTPAEKIAYHKARWDRILG